MSIKKKGKKPRNSKAEARKLEKYPLPNNKEELDINAIVKEARERGYFDIGLYKKLSIQELRIIYAELKRRGIPTEPPETSMDRKTAMTIINALKTGTVPQCDLAPLSVGRSILREHLTKDLNDVARGSPKVRFLNAPYGSGKTHSLWLLAETAFNEKFAVSFVTLSPRSCPLHSLLKVYGAILGGIHDSTNRKERGLERILNRWIEIYQRLGPEVTAERFAQLPHHIGTALAEYAGAICNPVRQNPHRAFLILKYLSGERCLKSELKGIGLDVVIDDNNALETLKDITTLVTQLGFRGLCIFLDEAESVLSFSRSKEINGAYENLYRIIQTAPRLRKCYFIYAATPGFFDDYSVSWYWPDTGFIDDSHIYPLEPLTDSESLQLAERIRNIYSIAYQFFAPPEKLRQAANLILKELGKGGAAHVGNFVRSIVAILERLRNG